MGQTRNHLARLDANDGALDPDWNPSPADTVYALAVHGDAVYVGGEFEDVGGISRTHLAALPVTASTTASTTAIPTLSSWALLMLSGLLLALPYGYRRR